jgi:hypothetical protein
VNRRKNATGGPDILFLCPPDRIPTSEIISQRTYLVCVRDVDPGFGGILEFAYIKLYA